MEYSSYNLPYYIVSKYSKNVMSLKNLNKNDKNHK